MGRPMFCILYEFVNSSETKNKYFGNKLKCSMLAIPVNNRGSLTGNGTKI